MKSVKALSVTLLSSLLLCTATSCSFFRRYFLEVEPFPALSIAQKGTVSLLLSCYFDDENLLFSDDLSEIESSFQTGKYPIVFYDSVRGLELCEEFGLYAYVSTIAMGNPQFVPLKEDLDSTQKVNVIANNERGSLGKTAKRMFENDPLYEIAFLDKNDLDFYTYLYEGKYVEEGYDYAFIAEPYATRLLTEKDSALYNEVYDEYTSNEDRGFDTSKKMYCESLRLFYQSFNETTPFNDRGIPQSGIFVDKAYYETHSESIDKILNLLNQLICNKCVKDANYTRTDFRELSADYNDPDEDMESELTRQAFQYQFDCVGVSWNEVSRLQAWHTVLGQDAPYEKFINRLEYVKDLDSYYGEDYLRAYYDYIGEAYPSESSFLQVKFD